MTPAHQGDGPANTIAKIDFSFVSEFFSLGNISVHTPRDSFDDVLHDLCRRSCRIMLEKDVAIITGLGDLRVHWYGAKKRHVHVLGDALAPARTQNLGDFTALRACEPAHVLHHSEHRHMKLPTECDGLAHVHVQQSRLPPRHPQGHRQIDGDRTLPHSPLS